jgi:hypothetical protein
MKQHHIAFILLFLLAGCANNNVKWYKTGASTNEFNVDKYDCIQQAQQQSGSAFVGQHVGYASNGWVTNWNLYNLCMNAKGWSLQDSSALPKAVDQKAVDPYSVIQDEFNKLSAICAKQEYAPLFVKTSCFFQYITFEQIADNTKITPDQKTIFPKYITEVEVVFYELIKEIRTNGNPDDMPGVDYLDSMRPEVDKDSLDLLNGVITWGEYNQRCNDLYTKTLAKLRELSQTKR